MKKQINVMDLLYILELDPSCVAFTKKSYRQALAGLDGFKELVGKQRKRLAKKYHPDSNGGDDTRMKEVNNAADLLLTIEVRPIPPPQMRPIRTGDMMFSFQRTDLYSDGTTTSYTWTS